MKFLIVALFVAYAAANPIDEKAAVVRSDYQWNPEGFQYGYETENGISGQATGQVKSIGKDEVALEVNGVNQYTAPNGEVIRVTYVADENGYHPQGDHLPTPPAPLPLSDQVLRTLQYIASHPYTEKS